MTPRGIAIGLVVAALMAAAITGALIASGAIRPSAPERGPSTALRDFGQVGDFHLTERSGRPLSRDDLKGKIWIADFFFTSCKGPCPKMTEAMAELQKTLADIADLRSVSFSLDPERDSAAVLSTYADAYGASKERWLFLTGPFEEIRALSERGFKFEAGKEQGEIFHGTFFALVDRSGHMRGYYKILDGGADERARLCADARRLSAERANP